MVMPDLYCRNHIQILDVAWNLIIKYYIDHLIQSILRVKQCLLNQDDYDKYYINNIYK